MYINTFSQYTVSQSNPWTVKYFKGLKSLAYKLEGKFNIK